MKHRLDLTDKLDFMNLWYVIIVINDLLIIFGTICKVSIEFRDFDNGLFTLTGILLGIGALLVYFGLLRYLGFFNQYNASLNSKLTFISTVLDSDFDAQKVLAFNFEIYGLHDYPVFRFLVCRLDNYWPVQVIEI